MDLIHVKKLLEKYNKGETSLAEERQISNFFLKEDVPSDLQTEKNRFTFFHLAQQEHTNKDFSIPFGPDKEFKTSGRVLSMKRYYSVITGLAASLLLFIGLHVYMNPQNQAISENPELAYLQTKKALLLISEKLNKGTEDLNQLARLNEAQELITNK